jgi:hypothetical protein
MAEHPKSDAILFTAMPIIYDMQGYPHFVVDFAERKPDGATKTVQAAMLLVRSFFDEGEQRMTSIDDFDLGLSDTPSTPPKSATKSSASAAKKAKSKDTQRKDSPNPPSA